MSLFIGNISSKVNEKDLQEKFGEFGKCKINFKNQFAFAEYTSDKEAKAAMEKLNKVNLGGSELNIEWSKKSSHYEPSSHRREISPKGKCYNCGRAGHYARDCPNKRRRTEPRRYYSGRRRSRSRSSRRHRSHRHKYTRSSSSSISRSSSRYHSGKRRYGRRSDSRSRDRSRSRHRDHRRRRDKDSDGDRERMRDRERRDKDKEKNKEREKEDEKDKDGGSSNSKDRSRSKSKSRSVDQSDERSNSKKSLKEGLQGQSLPLVQKDNSNEGEIQNEGKNDENKANE